MKISIPQQLAVRPRVDDLAQHASQEHAIGHGHDTVLHREEQDAEAYHFLDDFQLQKDVAASQRVDSIEVRCMDGPEHVVDAEDAQERHARRHFSVSTSVTTFVDENARTIIIGAMMKILVLIARRVISRTRSR